MDIQTLWSEHGTTIILGAILVAAVYLAYKLLGPKKKVFLEDQTLNVKCKDCGWQGTVTKYNQVCRKCNSANLERFS